MPKNLPEHWKILTFRPKPNYSLDTDPLRIAPPKVVCDAQRMALALAPAKQEALIQSIGRYSPSGPSPTIRLILILSGSPRRKWYVMRREWRLHLHLRSKRR